jgi:Skp family chaperone for outer membrane proteins
MIEANQSENFVSPLEARLHHEHSKQLKECTTKGEEDGNRNLPPIENDVITPFEKRLITKYQSQVEEIFVEGRQTLDEIHDKQYKPLKEKLETISDGEIEFQLQQAEQDKNRKLDEADHNHKDRLKDLHNNPEWLTGQRDFKLIEERFKIVSARLQREELHIQFKPFWLYVLLIISIGFAEIPLNYQVFVSFRETPLLTLIMALVLVISLPFLSHSSGKFLKQGKEKKTFYYLLVVAFILITIVSYFTAVLRMQYLATKGVLPENLETDKWTFFVVGIVLYFVGMVASYFAHDESIEFTEVHKRYYDLKASYSVIQSKVHVQIKKEKEHFNSEKEQIQNEYTKKKAEILDKVEHLKRSVHNAAGHHDKVLSYYRGLEKKVNQSCQEAIHHYRDTNLTYRTNHSQPESWKSDLPELEFRLQNLAELIKNPTI